MTEKTPSEETLIGKLVPITWPEAGIAVYANNLLAVSDFASTYLTFCQISPPACLGTPEEQRQALDGIRSIPAYPVARVVVSLGTLREIVKVLQSQIDLIDKRLPQSQFDLTDKRLPQ